MPKTRPIKMRSGVLGNTMLLPGGGVAGAVVAIWVPAKAKKRNRKVPTNSPSPATVLLRIVDGFDNIGSLVVPFPRPMSPFSELKERRRCLLEARLIFAV
jgi:hypothetical protein